MTGNDIAYYKAQNERRNMRLERKEQKRHNLASEQASYMQAIASQSSAAAAQQQAAIKQKEYQLNWETEYGLPYGTDPQDKSNYRRVQYGDTYYAVPNYSMPQTYILKSADQIEKEAKAKYEHEQAGKTKVEKYQRAADTAQRIVNLASSAINLGSKVYNTYSELLGEEHVPGTDLIIYGGQ